MMQALDGWLAAGGLPNLHAVLVHFPVALLPTALLLDLVCLITRRPWVDRAATALYLLGTIAAVAAYLSGQQASGEMWRFSGDAQTTMADHEDLALFTLIAFGIVTALRFIASWLARAHRVVRIGFFRLTALLAAAAAMTLLVTTAHHGGRLVYQYGMGVATPQPAEPPATDTE